MGEGRSGERVHHKYILTTRRLSIDTFIRTSNFI